MLGELLPVGPLPPLKVGEKRCCRVVTHPARTTASRAALDASRPRREKSPCWLFASGSPVDAAGLSPPAKARRESRDSGSVGLREPGRCVTSKRKSSISSSQRTYIMILLRCLFVFSHLIASDLPDCFPAGRSLTSSPPVAAPCRDATQQIVPKSLKGVNHSHQLEDIRWAVPLRRCALPALIV